MALDPSSSGRNLRIRYWDSEVRVFGTHKAQFEKSVKQLGDVDLQTVKSLDDISQGSCDLLVIAADHVPEDHFVPWLQKTQARITHKNQIWVPALILANISFKTIASLLHQIHKENWYFDIVSPDHLASVPIRVANLLRIHDHLHELKRYSDELIALQTRVSAIEKQFKTDSAPKE